MRDTCSYHDDPYNKDKKKRRYPRHVPYLRSRPDPQGFLGPTYVHGLQGHIDRRYEPMRV